MNRKQIVLGLVLADFTALTAWAVWQHGLIGLFDILLSSSASVLLLVDLAISLTLILVWMSRDARERGLAFVPYALLTACFGSVGTLLYLIRREGRAPAHAGIADTARAPHGSVA